MLNLLQWIITVLDNFARAISGISTWYKVEVLMAGARLSTGKRTVSAVLRTMELAQDTHYAQYHHVLSRASWSGLEVAGRLLGMLIDTFGSDEPLVFGIDETIERRRGEKIAAKGIDRDPVRSSKSHFVKASGLRWISLMWLTDIPWAQRVWALPFLTVLASSERYYASRQRATKTITDWAQQMVFQLRQWLPDRKLVIVGDSAYAVLDFLDACQHLPQPVTVITRLRLDAALYAPMPADAGHDRRHFIRAGSPGSRSAFNCAAIVFGLRGISGVPARLQKQPPGCYNIINCSMMQQKKLTLTPAIGLVPNPC